MPVAAAAAATTVTGSQASPGTMFSISFRATLSPSHVGHRTLGPMKSSGWSHQ